MAYPPVTPPSIVDVTDLTAMSSRHPGDHNSIADWLNVLIPGAWQYVNAQGGAAPAFVNSWVNYGSGWTAARFRREGGDICRIEGLVAGGANNSVVFTLPIGYRPAGNARFQAPVVATASATNYGWIQINPDGTIQLQYLGGGTGVVAASPLNCTFAIDPTTL